MSLRVVGNTRYGNGQRDLVAEITEKVPSYVQIEALKNAFPNGRVVRNEFYLGSLSGEAGQSLKINIDPSSSEFMRGMDFNTGDGIGGITKILMAAYDWKIKDVAEHFGTFLDDKCAVCVKKRGFKNCFKKSVPSKSNETLFQCQEAPGEAASRAHCSDKKQFFEQQLKYCSRFLQKKTNWARNCCKKMTGLLN